VGAPPEVDTGRTEREECLDIGQGGFFIPPLKLHISGIFGFQKFRDSVIPDDSGVIPQIPSVIPCDSSPIFNFDSIGHQGTARKSIKETKIKEGCRPV